MDLRFEDTEQKISSLNSEIEAQRKRIELLEQKVSDLLSAISAATVIDHKDARAAMRFVNQDYISSQFHRDD
jgi:cell division protein FtsL